MAFWTDNKVIGRLQDYFRRHWQRALRIRERLRFTEEAFHLLLAGGVGIIGGLVNILFYYATELVRLLFLRQPDDLVEVAERMTPWQRIVTPTFGGMCAGLVLYWGLRMAGSLRSSNLLAVDTRRGILAGGGALHADCEAALIDEGSRQEDIWGADWIPSTQQIRDEALINIRPNQNNPSMTILNPSLCSQINEIVQRLLRGV